MPLYTTLDLLNEAEKWGYAVPAFNAYNVESAIAIIQTAEKIKSPVIVQAYDRLFKSNDAMCVAACVKEMARISYIPIALHLDHGSGEESAMKAIRHGYTGLMIDGSMQEYKKNIELTSKIVNWGNYVNIPIEGELGHVGMAANGIEEGSFTEPDQAQDFVKRTGVDMLAIMVGSVHGIYKTKPKLDIDRIRTIKKRTGIPLVLHGGSGIPDNEIKNAIAAGIRKINVATSICQAYYEGFKYNKPEDAIYSKPLDIFMGKSIELVKKFIEQKIVLFGSDGKAGK
jgi:ketose-bisphosphate aldolase